MKVLFIFLVLIFNNSLVLNLENSVRVDEKPIVDEKVIENNSKIEEPVIKENYDTENTESVEQDSINKVITKENNNL